MNTLTSVYIFIRITYLRKIEFHTQFHLLFKILLHKYIYTNHETSIPYTNSVYTRNEKRKKRKRARNSESTSLYRNETIREARWITQIWKGLPLPQAREGGHSLNLIA